MKVRVQRTAEIVAENDHGGGLVVRIDGTGGQWSSSSGTWTCNELIEVLGEIAARAWHLGFDEGAECAEAALK